MPIYLLQRKTRLADVKMGEIDFFLHHGFVAKLNDAEILIHHSPLNERLVRPRDNLIIGRDTFRVLKEQLPSINETRIHGLNIRSMVLYKKICNIARSQGGEAAFEFTKDEVGAQLEEDAGVALRPPTFDYDKPSEFDDWVEGELEGMWQFVASHKATRRFGLLRTGAGHLLSSDILHAVEGLVDWRFWRLWSFRERDAIPELISKQKTSHIDF